MFELGEIHMHSSWQHANTCSQSGDELEGLGLWLLRPLVCRRPFISTTLECCANCAHGCSCTSLASRRCSFSCPRAAHACANSGVAYCKSNREPPTSVVPAMAPFQGRYMHDNAADVVSGLAWFWYLTPPAMGQGLHVKGGKDLCGPPRSRASSRAEHPRGPITPGH